MNPQQLLAGELVAARPNLNRPGILTLHRVGRRGGIDYHHALAHVASPILLADCVPHHLPRAAARIRAGAAREPAIAIVGSPARRPLPRLTPPRRILIDCRNPACWTRDIFRPLYADTLEPFLGAPFALLDTTRLWVSDVEQPPLHAADAQRR